MIIVISATPGISKDFAILTRMLYAAFLAEQGAAICVVADPAFASETTGPLGDIHSYVQHIKAEVTAGLSENDTLSLLKSSADREGRITTSDWRNPRRSRARNGNRTIRKVVLGNRQALRAAGNRNA